MNIAINVLGYQMIKIPILKMSTSTLLIIHYL